MPTIVQEICIEASPASRNDGSIHSNVGTGSQSVSQTATGSSIGHRGTGSQSVSTATKSMGSSLSAPRYAFSDDERQETGSASRGSNHSQKGVADDYKVANLRKAFDIVDKDGSGTIDAEELMELLEFRGVNMTEFEAQLLIDGYSSDGNHISFDDFCHAMLDFEGVEVIDLTKAFATGVECRKDSLPEQVNFRSTKSDQSSSSVSSSSMAVNWSRNKPRNARLAFGRIVDGPYVHTIVFVLILLDVLCVIMEMLLVLTWCHNPSEDHRRLAAAAVAGVAATTPVAWCNDCSDIQYTVELVLHSISVSILFIFAVQILLVMCAYRLRFFRNFFFVLDMVIIGGALFLELALHVRQGALLAVLLLWRFGRIVHGMVTTIEIGHKKIHAKINHVVLTQLQKKAIEMTEIKQRFKEFSEAKSDLVRARMLLKPTALTLENVDTVSLAELQRNCKLQIINNRDVMETLEALKEDLAGFEGKIDEHVTESWCHVRRQSVNMHGADRNTVLEEAAEAEADPRGSDSLEIVADDWRSRKSKSNISQVRSSRPSVLSRESAALVECKSQGSSWSSNSTVAREARQAIDLK